MGNDTKNEQMSTQALVDEMQNKRMEELHLVNEGQNKQLLVTTILGFAYLIWLIALTRWIVFHKCP